jgi:hypothetical protein
MGGRREFLQAGLAVSALPLVQSAFGHSGAPSLRESRARATAEALVALSVHKVIFDVNLPESRVFAREAAQIGLPALPFAGGDATDLWYHELDPLWRRQPLAIAGLTRFGPLFVLERLAWDRGMRVLYRAEQDHSPDQSVYSWVIGPRERA